jgi:protein gp37
MAKESSIEYCDSSLNLQMGCDGCELWNRRTRACYAGARTAQHAGRKGWPLAFEQPALFVARLEEALRWKDLRGTTRPGKPWLDGMPRVVFLNDMGDTFTEGLHVDWLAPLLPRLADSPHLWLVLTKRARRMLDFAARHDIPQNVWLGVSITNRQTAAARLPVFRQLRERLPHHVLWVSIEPLLEDVASVLTPEVLGCASWLVTGGESDQEGHRGRPCDLAWLRGLQALNRPGVACFMKQLGSQPVEGGRPLRLRHGHGADLGEWPEDLRVRQVPCAA